MRRTVRLFVYAAAMLAVAVGVAAGLRDDPGYKVGRSEISGKIVGLTEYQENRTETGHLAAQKSSEEEQNARAFVRQEQKVPAKEQGAPAVKTQEKKDDGGSVETSNTAPAKSEKKADTVSKEASSNPSKPVQVLTEKKSDVGSTASAEPEKKGNTSVRQFAESVERNQTAASVGNKPLSGEAVEGRGEDAVPEPSAAEAGKTEELKEKAGAVSGGSPASDALAEFRSDLAGETPAEKHEEKPEKAEAQYERVVTSARFSMHGSQIKLTLQGNAPMVGHYFTLENPDRVVLDLAGNWGIKMPAVPSNRLVRAVRIGQHDDKTRIVFDMKTRGKVALVPLNRNALELCIQ